VISYQYLAYKQLSRHCDICKIFGFEIPAINSRYMKSELSAYTLEISVTTKISGEVRVRWVILLRLV